MRMLLWLTVFLTALMAVSPPALHAQEKKGRIDGFEDANAGKSSDDRDDEEYEDEEAEESGGLFLDILELFFHILFDSGDEEEDEFYYDDTEEALPLNGVQGAGYGPAYLADSTRRFPAPEEVTPPISFGPYPFSGEGLVLEDSSGKNFLGRLTVARHHIDSDLYALRLNSMILFGERHGFMLDFYNYTERLENGSDHLQIVNLAYRNLFVASDEVLFSLTAGGTLLYPDGAKSALWGPALGLEGQFFINNPVSISGRLGFSGYTGNDARGFNIMMDAALFVGLHYRMGELYGGLRSLTPLTDTGASFFGPEFGIRFWF